MRGGPSLQSRDRSLQSRDTSRSASCRWRWVVATFIIKRPAKFWSQVSENKDIISYPVTGTPELYPQNCLFFYLIIGVVLIYNVVLASGVKQSASVTHGHITTFSLDSFPTQVSTEN